LIALASAFIALSVAQAPDGGTEPPPADVPDAGILSYYPDGRLPEGPPHWLHITGNKILPNEVYRHVVGMSDELVPDVETARTVERAIYDYLIDNGYELATVRASVADGAVYVDIDEGRLEKVVFRGRLTAQTLRFRLELFIDQEIFNRPALERQITRLEKEVGVKVVKWELVPTKNPTHVGPQLDTMVPAIEGIELLHAREKYELHFFFEEHEWGEGFGLDLRSGYIDGLEVGANLQAADVLLKGERIRIAASVGGGIHKGITTQNYYPSFTRAFGELQWFAPKFGYQRVRPYIWLTAQVVERQRPDLLIEKYNEVSTIGSGHFAVDFTSHFKATFGLGFQYRQIFNPVYAQILGFCIPIQPIGQRARAFVDVHGELALDNETERTDRSHTLEAGVRWYLGKPVADTPGDVPYLQFGWVYERYRVVIPFGWHDLWLKSRLRITWGDVQFHDEESLGELLRGVFGDVFVRKGGNASAEFRFSLSRDILKVSLFAEVAGWGEVQRFTLPNPVTMMSCGVAAGSAEVFRVGITGGPGFHALIQGMFQLDIYASFGVMSTGRVGYGALALLNKVF
jgi:hypothetical protein